MNTLIQSLLEAQEAILRNELEFDTTEEEMAFESFVNDDFSGKYGLDLYSDFDSLLAMESEDASAADNKKESWGQKVWNAIKAFFIKIRDIFASIGEAISRFFLRLRVKLTSTVKNDVIKKDIQNKLHSLPPETYSRYITSIKRFDAAFISFGQSIQKIFNYNDIICKQFEKMKDMYFNSKTINSNDLNNMLNKCNQCTTEISNYVEDTNKTVSQFDNTLKELGQYGIAKSDFSLIRYILYSTSDKSYDDNASNIKTKINVLKQIMVYCEKHKKFCNEFIKTYDNKSENRQVIDYMLKFCKLYMQAAMDTNKISNNYTKILKFYL